jgi:hypothetical protein
MLVLSIFVCRCGIFEVALVEKPDRIRLPLTAEEKGCGSAFISPGSGSRAENWEKNKAEKNAFFLDKKLQFTYP